MKKYYKIMMIVTSFILMGFVSTAVYAGDLDGKTYIGPSGRMGKDASEEEELQFKDGTFYSVGCAQYGFGKAPYQTRVEGNSILFEAVTTSPKNGKIAWAGTVTGNTVKATFIWTKKGLFGTKRQEKWFKGTLK